MTIDQFTSSDSDEWATPPEFVRPLADAIGGFDLDPASGAEQSPIARETFAEGDDGLSRRWFGTVWCNPPYSEIGEWTRKAVSESRVDGVGPVILLCKGDSSTDWWQWAASEASVIAMIDGRMQFSDGGDAPFPSHVMGFGKIPAGVKDVLARRGVVIEADQIYTRTEQERL